MKLEIYVTYHNAPKVVNEVSFRESSACSRPIVCSPYPILLPGGSSVQKDLCVLEFPSWSLLTSLVYWLGTPVIVANRLRHPEPCD